MILDHDLLPFFGRMNVGDVAPSDVQAWVATLTDRQLAPTTVRRVFTILDQLFDQAVALGFIAASPTERVRLPRITRREMRFLTPIELERLADAMDPRYRVMVLTMAWATFRIGEAAGLRHEDVDLLSGSLRVANNVVEVSSRLHEGPPKTAAGRRTMSLPASIVAELADHLDHAADRVYVFPSVAGGPLRVEKWRVQYWRPAVRSAGLAPLRPHDLKHTGVRSWRRPGLIRERSRGGLATRASRSRTTGMDTSFQRSTSRRRSSSKHSASASHLGQPPEDWTGH